MAASRVLPYYWQQTAATAAMRMLPTWVHRSDCGAPCVWVTQRDLLSAPPPLLLLV